jgi:hypothetical protein
VNKTTEWVVNLIHERDALKYECKELREGLTAVVVVLENVQDWQGALSIANEYLEQHDRRRRQSFSEL